MSENLNEESKTDEYGIIDPQAPGHITAHRENLEELAVYGEATGIPQMSDELFEQSNKGLVLPPSGEGMSSKFDRPTPTVSKRFVGIGPEHLKMAPTMEKLKEETDKVNSQLREKYGLSPKDEQTTN